MTDLLQNVTNLLQSVTVFAAALALIILVHEFGHIAAARLCGVRLLKYYGGFTRKMDPGSFAGKAVWQRFLIILAGPAASLLFAVVLASGAYQLGVEYVPCVLGGTTPGGPAWQAGLRPGDKILQIGKNGHPHEYLDFRRDLMPQVMLHGSDSPMDLLIRTEGQNEPEWISVLPSDRNRSRGQPATLGVVSSNTSTVQEASAWLKVFTQGGERAVLQPGDEIVAISGQSLPRDEETGLILGHHVEGYLAHHVTETLAMTVRRPVEGRSPSPASRDIDLLVPPVLRRGLGMAMEIGPVVAVQAGSPAEQAGFQNGDILLSIDGEEIQDPMTLPQRLLTCIDREVEFQVRRADRDDPVTLRATPEPPKGLGELAMDGVPLGLESIGLAVQVKNVVRSVAPESPASQAELRAGDEVISVRFVAADASQRQAMVAMFGDGFDQRILLQGEESNWPYVDRLLQMTPPGTQLEIDYRQQGKAWTATVVPVVSDRWCVASRGLVFAGLTQKRRANSWSEAFALGLGESRRSLVQSLTIAWRVVTRRMDRSQLGGPIAIASVTTHEASAGTAPLLQLLSLLSVTLALVSCLPIPGLDGGHLIFLIIEAVTGKSLDRRIQITLTILSLVGVLIATSMLLTPCLSQLVRLVSLLRQKSANQSLDSQQQGGRSHTP